MGAIEAVMQLLAAAQRTLDQAVRAQREARLRIRELESEVATLRVELEQMRAEKAALGAFGFVAKGGARA